MTEEAMTAVSKMKAKHQITHLVHNNYTPHSPMMTNKHNKDKITLETSSIVCICPAFYIDVEY